MKGLDFSNGFSDSTKLKLEIITEYFVVFMEIVSRLEKVNTIRIYDFFCGPGFNENDPGSPIILLRNVNDILARRQYSNKEIVLVFNDVKKTHVDKLKENIIQENIPNKVIIEYHNEEFKTLLPKEIGYISNKNTASLLWLDQNGIDQIEEDIFRQISNCKLCDILFFIASNTLKRFFEHPNIKKYFRSEKLKDAGKMAVSNIHRLATDLYRGFIPKNKEYYLASFSIRKERDRNTKSKELTGNIYGIIFGSNSLRGLEKFLEVCWSKDKITGEANFNIDKEPIRDGQLSIIEEDNKIRKVDMFKKRLIEYLRNNKCDNYMVYKFTLENGFLPKHTLDILKPIREEEKLLVVSKNKPNITIRKNAYYINHEYFKNEVLYILRD